jgi:hypothetical protein
VDWGVEKVKQEEEAVVAVVMVRCLRRECAVSELFLSLKARGALFSFFSLFLVRDGHVPFVYIYPFATWDFGSVM